MIKLENVSKIFGTKNVETLAVINANLEIDNKEFMAISGQSGSGKSTLVSLIGLLDLPTSGQIFVEGVDAASVTDADRARWRREKLGFVFQAFHLIPHLSVQQNVELALDGQKLCKAERKEAAFDALHRFGLSARTEHLPSQLSGGQQQRVALARAMVRSPSLLICDEPTGNLDTQNGEVVLDTLDELHSMGTAILVVTHSSRVANRAHTRFVMQDGVLMRTE